MKLKLSVLAVTVLTLCRAFGEEKEFTYKKTPQGELKLVVTQPHDTKRGDKHAAIVFFSGGAWANSNVGQFKEFADYLARRGMVAVRVDYRVSKTHNVGPDKCVEDARSAVRWVREHAAELGVDVDRIAASGASAGGHLAACTATPVSPDAETDDLKISCAPNALVLLNCVADLTIGGMATRAGGAEMARRISPVLHVSAQTPPTLILDGAEDNWVSTAKQFTDKATALGVRCEFHMAEGEGHQFSGRSPWREATIRKMDEFFISLGWLSGSPVNEAPKVAAWVRYQPAATPREISSKDKLVEMHTMREKMMARKAGATTPKPEDTPAKPGATPTPSPRGLAGRFALGEQQLQMMLRRYPDADLNKDGKLTFDEFREYRSKTPGAKPTPSPASTPAPSANVAPAGAVEVTITSDKPVPVNPRVYGTWCEEMFTKGLAQEPEYIAALEELKFKTFLFPGGSLSYYHHPHGPGGFNMKPEEVAHSKFGEEGAAKKKASVNADMANAIIERYLRTNSDPDYFEQYIRFVKASGGESVFVANVLNGTVDELDEYLTRMRAEKIPIAAVVLGVEMHLGPAQVLGQDGYLERIKPFIAMLGAKYPGVPIVAHSTPVGRAVELARGSHHDWNHALAALPGITAFSQYGWTEFAGQPRLQRNATAQTPEDVWRQYDEFTRTFPERQIAAYQKDWGADKKMVLTQWGAHSDHNTAVLGLHVANFHFFLAQYNAAHDDYFAAATSSLNLAEKSRTGGKLELLTPYLYTKPFRHLFSGDKKLLTATTQNAEAVKALAAVGADGRQYIYLLNSGTAVTLGKVSVNGATLAGDARVTVESAAGTKTFAGEKTLREVVLDPFSLTLLITASAKKTAQKKEYDKNAGPRPDIEDLAYGNHERLKLDLWKAKSDAPSPLLVFYHGGGGDKLMYRENPLLPFCLSHGISIAAVNFRPNHEFPEPIPTQDAGRAIQFLRAKAHEFNIDPKRIASFGTSLGANVAIALAYDGDLADAKSDDPILRESSRPSFLITADAGGGFGASTRNIAKDAPPLLMIYHMALKDVANLKDTPKRELLHNPMFGQMLKRKLDAAGVENFLYHGGNPAPPDAEQQFVLKHFFGAPNP